MNHRTLDELSHYLREDLGWRKKENHVLQSTVRNATDAKKQAVLRGAVASLYAHWEGFVKAACRAYLEFVANRRLNHHELAFPFLGLALRLRLRRIEEDNQRLDSHLDFATWLVDEWQHRAKLPKSEDVIGTSNLNSEVFKSFIRGLGLPYVADYERAEKPIIDSLVEMRNHLAHGAWQVVDETTYDEYYMWIFKLMDRVCEQIEDAVALQQYRRAMAGIV